MQVKLKKAKMWQWLSGDYEENIHTKKKNVICFAYKQDKVFRRFKEKVKFIDMIKEFKVNNNLQN